MRLISIFIIALIPIFTFCLNLLFLVGKEDFYYQLYEKDGVYESFGKEEIVHNATKNLLGYFRGKNELEQNFFSNQAKLHLADVKNLINLAKVVVAVSSAMISGLILGFKNKLDIQKDIIWGFVTTLTITFIMSLLVFTAFSQTFEKFHLLLFRNSLWLFSPEDSLVRLSPQTFFVDFAKKLFENIIITCAISIAALMTLGKCRLKQ